MSIYQLPVSQDAIAFRIKRSIEHWRVWTTHYYNSAGTEFWDHRGESKPLDSASTIEEIPPDFSWPYLFKSPEDERFALQTAASIIGVEQVSQVNAIGNSISTFTAYEIVVPADDGSTVTSGWYYYTVDSIGIDYCAGRAAGSDDDIIVAGVLTVCFLLLLLALLLTATGKVDEIWERNKILLMNC